MYGRQYAAPLVLCNASRTAMKVLVGCRPELNPWLSITPEYGFIQVRA